MVQSRAAQGSCRIMCLNDMLSCLSQKVRYWKLAEQLLACFCFTSSKVTKPMEIIQNGSTQLSMLLHAHLGMLLSYTLLTAIFISSAQHEKFSFFTRSLREQDRLPRKVYVVLAKSLELQPGIYSLVHIVLISSLLLVFRKDFYSGAPIRENLVIT